jgi:hypothetical protein
MLVPIAQTSFRNADHTTSAPETIGPLRNLLLWEARRVPHSFCLKQMTIRVFCDDFQTRANCEPQEWDEGILVPNAVHVVVACLSDQRSSSFSTPMKSLQNSGFYLFGGFYFVGCPGTLSSMIWSNIRANEPAAEPAKSYFLDWSVLAAFQSRRNRRQ